ncbi:hypothetical protein SAMN02745121_05674 [Nannocystis exedens]|uniref:Knr4/Smi1-like domain-containing protein n=1 Tax=Nannocystis exedens TaxID=54 RepID=A0A1I2DPY1_9BACT|nr:hypothetical protein [Nannocystis exedens]PCC68993.1 hypothetical protein NAEX_02015 [Nannocystis exedens]SFE82586.1 hypothetical protein SAMN02745121_05674 [Nannocystis exedens]
MPKRLTTTIPGAFGEPFLRWLGAATEETWRRVAEPTLADYEENGAGGCHWRRGTRWTGGLSDAEVERIEQRHEVRFPADHRLFLRVLHATEPWMQGAGFGADDRMVPYEAPGFYHWQRDEAAIRAAFAGVIDGLVFDVEENALWRDSWGPRPGDADERRARVAALVGRAPRLLPIYGHRYVLAEGPTLVLSVWQSDIIVYGRDLRDYLLHELIDVEHERPAPVDTAAIPFWGELIG